MITRSHDISFLAWHLCSHRTLVTDDCIIHVMTRCWHGTMWHQPRWPPGDKGLGWAALLNSLFIGRKITASRGQSYDKTFNETSPSIGNYERREKYESPLLSLNGHFSSPNLDSRLHSKRLWLDPLDDNYQDFPPMRGLNNWRLDVYYMKLSWIFTKLPSLW